MKNASKGSKRFKKQNSKFKKQELSKNKKSFRQGIKYRAMSVDLYGIYCSTH